jgi:GntR family phosphonate transport system transcriptional regulator
MADAAAGKSATAQAHPLERQSGVALWRQIADQIRLLAATGELGHDGRLPPEMALAARFGVNRHTVRSAIAQLTQEGLLRAEQGRGTFAVRSGRLAYPITRRTRFSTGLEGQARSLQARLLAEAVEMADRRIAGALHLEDGARVIRLETLSEADGWPVSRATSWFAAERFSGIARRFAETGSITAALKALGIHDYVRRSTLISARHAGHEELQQLQLAPGAIVIVTEAINDDLEGRPIQYSQTRFAADRIELRVEAED